MTLELNRGFTHNSVCKSILQAREFNNYGKHVNMYIYLYIYLCAYTQTCVSVCTCCTSGPLWVCCHRVCVIVCVSSCEKKSERKRENLYECRITSATQTDHWK